MNESASADLANIIYLLGNKFDLHTKEKKIDYEYLLQLKKEIILLDNITAGAKIANLKQDLHRKDTRYYYQEPYLLVFLSYAYSVLGVGVDSQKFARDAQRSYYWPNDWDRGLAYWFLGVVYLQNELIEEARNELDTSIKTFERYIQDSRDSTSEHQYEIEADCKEIVKKILTLKRRLPLRKVQPATSDLFDPPYTQFASIDPVRETGHSGMGGDDADGKKNDGGSGSSNGNRGGAGDAGSPRGENTGGTFGAESQSSTSINIHIPVEIHTTDEFDQVAIFDQNNRQHLEASQVLANHEEIDFFSWQWLPGLESDTGHKSRLSNGMEVQPDLPPDDLMGLNYIVTPSFPVYGSATAGPDGIPFLDEPDYRAAVEEIPLIQIDGVDHKLYSATEGKKQISISALDYLTSIVPPNTRERFKLNGKIYGWLKVVGSSMNKSIPVPIESGDYVLFCENDDLKYSIGKIVVTALKEANSSLYRLKIKRLKNIDVESAHLKDKKNGKQQVERLVLRSESSFDSDPETGEEYKDIDLVGNSRVFGYVIAVASIKPK